MEIRQGSDHFQDVTHFFFFGLQIIDIGFVGGNFDRDTIDDLQSIAGKADEFTIKSLVMGNFMDIAGDMFALGKMMGEQPPK